MKYLRRFSENTEEWSIEDWCGKFHIINYEINENDMVDVAGDVEFIGLNLYKIPIQFGDVSRSFNCSNNQLSTLKGCAINVGEYFNCGANKIITLKEGPKKVGGMYDCSGNRLEKLENLPIEIDGSFYCENNKITSLIGGPIEVNGNYNCQRNLLTSLEGAPEKLKSYFHCDENPIYEVFKLFKIYERYQASLDYKYWRGKDIVRGRFKKACEDAEIKMPESIKGYKYIDL
jgi:hypothetical protein